MNHSVLFYGKNISQEMINETEHCLSSTCVIKERREIVPMMTSVTNRWSPFDGTAPSTIKVKNSAGHLIIIIKKATKKVHVALLTLHV